MIREGILPVGTVRPVGVTNVLPVGCHDQRGDTTSRYCQASWLYYQ